MRAAARSRSAYLANASRHGLSVGDDRQLLNFSRQILKGGEHT